MNILLLEPAYKNKYPPLGLMKLSTFHKKRGDQVFFSKGVDGKLPKNKFERIYINSLFTFEWATTRQAIDFAYTLTDNKSNIYLGGITATIMTEFVQQEAPEINIVSGLLNASGKINLPQEETIDTLAPDYSILSQTEYKYPLENDYIAYSTRGCGMNCSFCAVQKLEPQFIDYVCIKKQIQDIKHYSGEKCNLLLMDNNVLKSPKLEKIVDDIIELGFGRGAKVKRGNARRPVKRYVDFNQGLDANFLTKQKAELLAKIELRPTRIAFDNIAQTEKYIQAVRLCFDAGLRNFSNYILYNSDAATWKGQNLQADKPADLYNRLKINVDLCEQLQEENVKHTSKEAVSIYSFPMRYIPLTDTKRGYVGTYWNKKHLRAIQVFITPTQGKGVASKAFFSASFGSDLQEFMIFIDMPENIMTRRGIYVENKKHTYEEKLAKMAKVNFNQRLVQEWRTLYNKMYKLGVWTEFAEKYIHPNTFPLETFYKIQDPLFKEMYAYYVTPDVMARNIRKMAASEREFLDNTFLKQDKYLSRLFYNL
mgnify:CR=1 FL=1